MSTVVCKLPNAGLGNQLFPLIHAYLFAELNGLPVIVTGYHRFKIGPYLRREKSKRTYKRFFRFQKTLIGEYFDKVRIRKLKKNRQVVNEPEVRKMDSVELENKLFVFEEVSDYHDYFGRLKEYRQQVINILFSIVDSRITNKLRKQEEPIIGVHIRMGDFRRLKQGEVYNSGHVRTPQEFFINCIKDIRNLNGNNLPVSVFTDGYKEEISEILKLHNVQTVDNNSDLVDLLLLSKSKIMLPTHGSTFSAWAAFLSDAPVVLPFPYEKKLREDEFYKNVYEGKFDKENEILRKNIREINE